MPSPHLNGFNLHYERAGQGPPVVYIHGGFASLASRLTPPADYAWGWEQAFSTHFDFIEYERRGCYRSGCPEGGYGLPNQAADLEALLDHLKIRRAHLIGSSAGGPIGLLFAATRPKRVRSLTLAGTGLNLFKLPDDPITRVIQAQITLLETQGAEAAFAARPAGVETSFGVLWELEEMKERGTLERYLASQAERNQRAAGLEHAVRLRHYAAELRSMGAYIDIRPAPLRGLGQGAHAGGARDQRPRGAGEPGRGTGAGHRGRAAGNPGARKPYPGDSQPKGAGARAPIYP